MRFNKSDKFKIFCSISICCIITVFFYFTLHVTLQRYKDQLNLETQHSIKTIEIIRNFENKYGDLDDYLKKLDERFLLTQNSLPSSMKQGEFINFLQQTAIEQNIKIISMVPGIIQPVNLSSDFEKINVESIEDFEEEEKYFTENAKLETDFDNLMKGVSCLPINVKIECDYISLLRFLKDIEQNERLTLINDFTINSKNNGDTLNCEIKLMIFSFDDFNSVK